MYSYGPPQSNLYHAVPPSLSSSSHFQSEDIELELRQQPKEALVTTDGKEKTRKPVDPPPIIQLKIKAPADPAQHFLQSPYLFMCTSLYKDATNEAWDGNANKSLAGSLVSSLHRLKDVDNKDGGFFVFGDISVKIQGRFRLHFSLFDLHKDTCEVQYLGSITSKAFNVLLPKDFKGMDESTYLSRAFSDQGVRLRLRKEPRAMMGNKRPYPHGMDAHVSNAPIRPNMSEYPSFDDSTSPRKRYRADEFRPDAGDVKRDSYADHSSVSAPPLSTSYGQTHGLVRQPNMPNYTIPPTYSHYSSMTAGSPSPFLFRSPVPAYDFGLLSSNGAIRGPISTANDGSARTQQFPMPMQGPENDLEEWQVGQR